MRPRFTHGLVVVGVALVGSMLSGCATAQRATLSALQQRAAYDLSCPPAWLELVHVDSRTKVVGGCGHRLVYLEDCADVGDALACSWRIDSPGGLAAHAPSDPAWRAPAAAAARPIATQLFGPGDGARPAPGPGAPDPLAVPPARPTERSYSTDLFGGPSQPIVTPPPGRALPSDLFGPSAPSVPAPR